MEHVYIIAEIGCNHCGAPQMAKKMVEEAKLCGVDAVKFQTFKAAELISKFAPKAEYQKVTTGNDENQLEMTRKLELSYNDFIVLRNYAISLGLDVFSTPFDVDSIDFLQRSGQAVWKIPSGEVTNLPFLERIAKIKVADKKIILSTGMCTMEEVHKAVNIICKISEVEAMSDSKQKDTESLTGDKKRLSELKQELNDLTTSYVSHKYTKEGASRTNIIDQWLEQTLLFEKAKAELLIVQNARQELNDRYVFFAPVGTTIKQKERSINFTERSYLTVLQSYNEALLRKKNLEMTSATLKVLNEPTYPIASNSTNRKQIVIAACIGSFLIIIALLLLIEILDRTLRDANRTKRVTGFKVIGAVPSPSSSRYGGLAKTYVQLSIKELSNSILRFLTKRKSPGVFIINLFSTSENSGEDIVGNLICGYMQSRMLNTRFITYGEDFNTDSTQYLLAKNITDFYTLQGEDILIVAYPPLSSSNIPTALLHDANVNILVSPADRGWKTIDKQLCEQLTTQMGKTDVPFRVCLTNAKREAVEDFTGQLPPYTLLRRVSYRFSQLSLTEKIIFNLSRKAKETEEDDDE